MGRPVANSTAIYPRRNSHSERPGPPHDGFILMAQPVNLHMAASIQLIKTLDGGRDPFEDSRRGRK